VSEGFWFTSPRFAIEPGEDENTNEGIYGRQLAAWLASGLEAAGYAVEPVIAEDFGYCVMLQRVPFLLWVGCGSVDDESVDDALDGQPLWHCFAVAEVPVLKRLFGRPDTAPALAKLDAALRRLLASEPTIRLIPAP